MRTINSSKVVVPESDGFPDPMHAPSEWLGYSENVKRVVSGFPVVHAVLGNTYHLWQLQAEIRDYGVIRKKCVALQEALGHLPDSIPVDPSRLKFEPDGSIDVGNVPDSPSVEQVDRLVAEYPAVAAVFGNSQSRWELVRDALKRCAQWHGFPSALRTECAFRRAEILKECDNFFPAE